MSLNRSACTAEIKVTGHDRSQSGSATLMALLALVLTTSVGLTIMQIGQTRVSKQVLVSYDLRAAIEMINTKILTIMNHKASGLNTIANAYYNGTGYTNGVGIVSFGCIMLDKDCSEATNLTTIGGVQHIIGADGIVLMDWSAPTGPNPYGLVYYNPNIPSSGFQMDGTVCSSFPSATCAIHVNLGWVAKCTVGPPCYVAPLPVGTPSQVQVNLFAEYSLASQYTTASVSAANYNGFIYGH